MPALRNRVVLAARGVKAFLGIEAGLVRGGTPISLEQEIRSLHHQVAEREKEIARLQEKLAASGRRMPRVDPEKVVWIFGVARVGSTWLASMMGEPAGYTVWNEPRVGSLLGDFYYGRGACNGEARGILGDSEEGRSRTIRAFILAAAGAKFGRRMDGGYLVIKEPNGSDGAPLLARALPESRVIFMVRDPRDVVASSLGAATGGGWYAEARKQRGTAIQQSPEEIVESRAKRYLEYISRSREAYESHEGPKTLVYYEELRADALGTLKRIYSELGIAAKEKDLARAVEKHAWENIPVEEKGPERFYRKATPGGWREDLTPEQARNVERITAPLLEEFYPA